MALRRSCARHAQVGACLEAVSAAGRPQRRRVPRSRRVQPEAGGVSVHRRLGRPPLPRAAAAPVQQSQGRARQARDRRALRRQLRRRARPLLLRRPQDPLPAAPPTRVRAGGHSGRQAARRAAPLPPARAGWLMGDGAADLGAEQGRGAEVGAAMGQADRARLRPGTRTTRTTRTTRATRTPALGLHLLWLHLLWLHLSI